MVYHSIPPLSFDHLTRLVRTLEGNRELIEHVVELGVDWLTGKECEVMVGRVMPLLGGEGFQNLISLDLKSQILPSLPTSTIASLHCSYQFWAQKKRRE